MFASILRAWIREWGPRSFYSVLTSTEVTVPGPTRGVLEAAELITPKSLNYKFRKGRSTDDKLLGPVITQGVLNGAT